MPPPLTTSRIRPTLVGNPHEPALTKFYWGIIPVYEYTAIYSIYIYTVDIGYGNIAQNRMYIFYVYIQRKPCTSKTRKWRFTKWNSHKSSNETANLLQSIKTCKLLSLCFHTCTQILRGFCLWKFGRFVSENICFSVALFTCWLFFCS